MSEESRNSLAERFKNLSPKARQYLVLGSVGTVFLGLVLGSVALWDNQASAVPQAGNEERKTKNIVTPGTQVDPRDVWMAQSSQQLKEMDTVIQGLKQKLADVEQKQAVPQPVPHQAGVLPPLPPMPPPTPPAPSQTQPAATGADGVKPVPIAPVPPAQPKEPGIAAFEVSDGSITASQPEPEKQARTYVPSGSFMRVALLGGLDAPTGGQAQSNPHPILMRVQDNAFLPNRYRFKIKECLVLGASHGDISSERAYIRLESLSCIRHDGKAVDVPVKGYVVGEDGKAGMRGRLVSKQGQVLANALVAGIGAGIGQAFQQSATTVSTNPLGSVGTVDPGKQFQAGIGTGVGKALDRLSQYYITLAEKMFPIIEVDAGRTVDVVFTKGFSLEAESAGGDPDTYTDIWRRGREIQKRPLEPYQAN